MAKQGYHHGNLREALVEAALKLIADKGPHGFSFAEVAREPGFIERLQSECKVTLASPTTLAAYLNALKMGFRTLAVQKQSAEIMKLLAVARTQFQKFGDELTKVATKLDESRKAIEQTVKRTGLIDRRLRSVDVATTDEVDAMLPPGTDDSAEPDDGSD